MRRLLNGDIYQVAVDSQKGGKKDLHIETTQKTWMADVAHWQIERAGKSSLNSQQLHKIINSKTKSTKAKNLNGIVFEG